MTLIHETGHELSKYKEVASQNPDGSYKYYTDLNYKNKQGEIGYNTEENIWKTDNYRPGTVPQVGPRPPGVDGIESEKYRPDVVEDIIKKAQETLDGLNSLPTLPVVPLR